MEVSVYNYNHVIKIVTRTVNNNNACLLTSENYQSLCFIEIYKQSERNSLIIIDNFIK